MADRPILFSAPMVRALLSGTKTQTRRALKPQPFEPFFCDGYWSDRGQVGRDGDGEPKITRYDIGDRLWVRETWARACECDEDDQPASAMMTYYRADGEPFSRYIDPNTDQERDGIPWRPSIFMPRHYSRLTLIVTDVRVQRLQDISEADAVAEGIYSHFDDGLQAMLYSFRRQGEIVRGKTVASPAGWSTAVHAYAALWDSINGAGSWDTTQWVAAYSFSVERRNIDAGA